MTTLSIIGSGNMAAAIGSRAAKHGYTVELMSRNSAKALALSDQIGHGATVGTFGERPAGDIVIVAVLYAGAVDVVAHYGDALAGKILVDLTNPFNADADGLVTTAGSSVSELRDRKIRVNVLTPGQVATPMMTAVMDEQIKAQFESVIPRRAMGSPEEIASVALFLASDDSSYVNGMELVVDGGTTVI